MRIKLSKVNSKKSTNKKQKINVDIKGTPKMIPNDMIMSTINSSVIYDNERQSSNNLRLTITINTICSNVLFNRVSEIVYGDGSQNVTFADDLLLGGTEAENIVNGKLYSRNKYSSRHDLIDDTQISNLGFSYYCGLDIFDNHILRNTTNKCICPQTTATNVPIAEKNDFNTIRDRFRNGIGEYISTYTPTENAVVGADKYRKTHMYDVGDLMSFSDSVSMHLYEQNGWYGFSNKTNLKTIYDDYKNGELNRVICNKPSNSFIQMYPSSDLFSFTPKYNSKKNRMEKNWLYFLTYPSENIKNGVPFINESTNSLKVILFDDQYHKSQNNNIIKLYSITKHGMSVNNRVNVYNGDVLIISNANVIEVVNDFEFLIESTNIISDNWLYFNDIPKIIEYKNNYFIPSSVSNLIFTSSNSDSKKKYLYLLKTNNGYKVNMDVDINISYKRVINGEEVEYYVRKFSKLVKKDGNEYKNQIGNLGFSKNIYGDDISEIVYTDDINIEGITDNLGRPLTSIYFTIIKNNAGYKEWYGYGKDVDINNDIVEFSHAFGKLNCGFMLSDYTIPYIMLDNEQYEYANIKCMSNLNGFGKGMNITCINHSSTNEFNDEISINDANFYGDLCCFSPSTYSEIIIDDCMFRFNTAQRECAGNKYIQNGQTIIINESDFTYGVDFETSNTPINNTSSVSTGHQVPEGYYYKPHHEIKIHTFSWELESQYPKNLPIKKNEKIISDDTTYYKIQLPTVEFFEIGDNIIIYNNGLIHEGMVIGIDNEKVIRCIFNDEPQIDNESRLIRVGYGIPKYAKLSNDGTQRFFWRNFIKNGYDTFSMIEQYPFTNGSFYIYKPITLFLKRQDDGSVSAITNKSMSDTSYTSNKVFSENSSIDNYYIEKDMSC